MIIRFERALHEVWFWTYITFYALWLRYRSPKPTHCEGCGCLLSDGEDFACQGCMTW